MSDAGQTPHEEAIEFITGQRCRCDADISRICATLDEETKQLIVTKQREIVASRNLSRPLRWPSV